MLLVGSGLTMVDIAISYGHCQVHTVSRHGLLPLAHAADPPPPAPAPLPEAPITAASVRRLVFGRIRELDGDWRTAVDGMRPITQQLWSRLDGTARRELLVHAQGRWERVRHRMAPELCAWLSARHEQGLLTVRPASVVGARDTGASLIAELSDATSVQADLVVNCTGRCSVLDSDDPLVSGLLARGSARRDSLGLGFATHPDGRLVSADELPAWTLGQLRLGELWESTAIPEIRDQAAELAGSILARAGADTREVA